MFTVELGAVSVVCGQCGARYDLNGKLREVAREADSVLDDIEHTFEGPCPRCAAPDDDGGDEVVAAE